MSFRDSIDTVCFWTLSLQTVYLCALHSCYLILLWSSILHLRSVEKSFYTLEDQNFRQFFLPTLKTNQMSSKHFLVIRHHIEDKTFVFNHGNLSSMSFRRHSKSHCRTFSRAMCYWLTGYCVLEKDEKSGMDWIGLDWRRRQCRVWIGERIELGRHWSSWKHCDWDLKIDWDYIAKHTTTPQHHNITTQQTHDNR